MQPKIEDITYYEGDSFTLIITPKDSTGEPLDLSEVTDTYFRLAAERDNIIKWNHEGLSRVELINGVQCIICELTSVLGEQLAHGYVYDIGYWKGVDRITILTGTFNLMSEVKVSVSP